MEARVDDQGWTFLTSHGLALLAIARDPSVRLRDIAEIIGVTERTAQRVVTDLTNAGYVRRERVHRRNVYTVQPDLPFRIPAILERSIGELLAALAPKALAAAAERQSDPLATTQPLVLPTGSEGSDGREDGAGDGAEDGAGRRSGADRLPGAPTASRRP